MKHDPERDARDYAQSVQADAQEIAARFPEEKTMHTPDRELIVAARAIEGFRERVIHLETINAQLLGALKAIMPLANTGFFAMPRSPHTKKHQAILRAANTLIGAAKETA